MSTSILYPFVKYTFDDGKAIYSPDLETARSLVGAGNKSLTLLGSVIPGDGGGGVFYWSPTYNGVDDGGITAFFPYAVGVGAWVRLPGVGSGTGRVTISDIPPARPHVGDLWWDSAIGAGGTQLYIWYVDPTGPGQWVAASNVGSSAAAGAVNVVSLGADPSGIVDSSTAINQAAQMQQTTGIGRTVYLPAGNYRINHQLILSNSLTLEGDGRGNTFLLIDQSFDPAASSVILCQAPSADWGVTIKDLSISFAQPSDLTSRSSLKTLAAGGTSGTGGTGVQYPWAVWGPVGSGRIKIENVQVRGAWNGFLFDTVFWIDGIEMGAIGTGLAQAQNASVNDWCFIGKYESWNYGWNTSGQLGIYIDGNTIAMQFGNAANPSFQTGVKAGTIANLGGRVIFYGAGWSDFTSLSNDSDTASLEVYGHLWLEITNFYYTASGNAVRPGITVQIAASNPSRLLINNMYAHTSSPFPLVSVSGNGEAYIQHFFMIYYPLATSALVDNGGELFISNGRLVGGTGTHTAPLIHQISGDMVIGDVRVDGGGSGVGVQFDSDIAGNFLGNVILAGGATIVLPSTIINGYYAGYSVLTSTQGMNISGQANFEGPIIVGSATGSPNVVLEGPAGSQRNLLWQTSSSLRFGIALIGTETGVGNAGADFHIQNFDDTGTAIAPAGAPVVITRATGQFHAAYGVTSGNSLGASGGGFTSDGPLGTVHGLYTSGAGNHRWFIGQQSDPESTGNVGSSLFAQRFDDTGATVLGTPLRIIRSSGQIILSDLQASASYANDAAAATGGVPVGGLYRNGSVVQIRVV